MGATWFRQLNSGKTLQDAYKNACDNAEDYAGHQEGYNGTISTTYGVTDLSVNFKNSKMKLEAYISSQMERLNKRECAAICIQEPVGNNNKNKSQVEHIVTPGTKKWVLKYVVYNYYNDQLIGSFSTKGDAVKKAREVTEKHQTSTYINMEKLLEKGDSRVAKITYKKSTNERDGRWVFFGWAAE
jgi:hypothetical protein